MVCRSSSRGAKVVGKMMYPPPLGGTMRPLRGSGQNKTGGVRETLLTFGA